MGTVIKWALYFVVLQMVFNTCGEHWVIGGFMCSLVASRFWPEEKEEKKTKRGEGKGKWGRERGEKE